MLCLSSWPIWMDRLHGVPMLKRLTMLQAREISAQRTEYIVQVPAIHDRTGRKCTSFLGEDRCDKKTRLMPILFYAVRPVQTPSAEAQTAGYPGSHVMDLHWTVNIKSWLLLVSAPLCTYRTLVAFLGWSRSFVCRPNTTCNESQAGKACLVGVLIA